MFNGYNLVIFERIYKRIGDSRESSRKNLSIGTNLAFLALFVQKLQGKRGGLSKKWKNSMTCTRGRYKM